MIRSIVESIFFKAISSFIPLLTVPLLLSNLGKSQYAVWVTITSLIAWISLFDFGIGYSLKNRVAEAIALRNTPEINKLFAGTFQVYFIITGIIFLCFIFSLFTVNIFSDHKLLAIAVYAPVILSFQLAIGNFLLQAQSRFKVLNFLLLLQGVLWLIVLVMSKYNFIQPRLLSLGLIYGLLYLSINGLIFYLGMSVLQFRRSELLNVEHLKTQKSSIFAGLRFFLLQVASLILYSVGNIIAYDHLDLATVAKYDIVNKVFFLGISIFNVLISIFWVEISKAKAAGRRDKLIQVRKQLLICAAGFSLASFGVTTVLPILTSYWTGGEIAVVHSELYSFAFLISVQAIAYSGAVFLNAFEELIGQIIFSIVAAALMFPLTKFLILLGWGVSAVPLAAGILTVPTMIYVNAKARKCINSIMA